MTMVNSAMKHLPLIDQLKTTDELHLWITQQALEVLTDRHYYWLHEQKNRYFGEP